jgi:hypothetical protein
LISQRWNDLYHKIIKRKSRICPKCYTFDSSGHQYLHVGCFDYFKQAAKENACMDILAISCGICKQNGIIAGALEGGHVHLIRWIHKYIYDGYIGTLFWDEFYVACKKEYLDTIKYVLKKFTKKFSYCPVDKRQFKIIKGTCSSRVINLIQEYIKD